jgi:hypothetical protein
MTFATVRRSLIGIGVGGVFEFKRDRRQRNVF